MELLRDRYEPLESIGSGGQGEVLRALDHQHDRVVALKIRPAADAESRASLLSEARVLLGLRPHPGLPLVREDFFIDDRYVIVMDWVEGIDLRTLLDRQGDPGLPVRSVISYLGDVADALDHLHAHVPSIVHGDVKPANMILAPGGKVVLVDFGIATDAGERALGSGTWGYIAPEVAAGEGATPAADVFGLAATAVMLLTGQGPDGSLPEWEGIPALQGRSLGRALRLGLSVDAKRRPRRAGELMDRLRAWRETDLPTGIVTFLLTDVEGSTALWDAHADVMPRVILRHEQLVAEAVESNAGRFIKSRGEGDSTLSVFVKPLDAATAAIAVQRALDTEPWPVGIDLRVRAAMHTGDAQLREGDYYGRTINRAARLRGMATGREILLSQATAELLSEGLAGDVEVVDLGVHELKGLERSERVFQLRLQDVQTEPRDPSGAPAEVSDVSRQPFTKPTTKYAMSGSVNIAYQAMGSGPVTVVACPPFAQNIDLMWEHPVFARPLERWASMARFVHFDKRGTGASDRSVGVPTFEERMDDFRAVIDAEGIEQAVVGGISESGPMAMLYAATYPEHVRGLILYGTFARTCSADDMPWAPSPEVVAQIGKAMSEAWGTPESLTTPAFSPSMMGDTGYREWMAHYESHSASRGQVAELMRWNIGIDVRHVLGSISVPTLVMHRRGDLLVPVESGRYLAERIPGAEYVELEGQDHIPWIGDTEPFFNACEDFLRRLSDVATPTHALETVLVAEDLGDSDRHRFPLEIVARGGRSLVEGRIASFAGAERAMACALSLRNLASTRSPRIALHCGEVSVHGVGGVGVDVARGVADRASPGEILVTATAKSLLNGVDVALDTAGMDPSGMDLWRVPIEAHGLD